MVLSFCSKVARNIITQFNSTYITISIQFDALFIVNLLTPSVVTEFWLGRITLFLTILIIIPCPWGMIIFSISGWWKCCMDSQIYLSLYTLYSLLHIVKCILCLSIDPRNQYTDITCWACTYLRRSGLDNFNVISIFWEMFISPSNAFVLVGSTYIPILTVRGCLRYVRCGVGYVKRDSDHSDHNIKSW